VICASSSSREMAAATDDAPSIGGLLKTGFIYSYYIRTGGEVTRKMCEFSLYF
jgi:hypothetical protein